MAGTGLSAWTPGRPDAQMPSRESQHAEAASLGDYICVALKFAGRAATSRTPANSRVYPFATPSNVTAQEINGSEKKKRDAMPIIGQDAWLFAALIYLVEIEAN